MRPRNERPVDPSGFRFAPEARVDVSILSYGRLGWDRVFAGGRGKETPPNMPEFALEIDQAAEVDLREAPDSPGILTVNAIYIKRLV